MTVIAHNLWSFISWHGSSELIVWSQGQATRQNVRNKWKENLVTSLCLIETQGYFIPEAKYFPRHVKENEKWRESRQWGKLECASFSFQPRNRDETVTSWTETLISSVSYFLLKSGFGNVRITLHGSSIFLKLGGGDISQTSPHTSVNYLSVHTKMELSCRCMILNLKAAEWYSWQVWQLCQMCKFVLEKKLEVKYYGTKRLFSTYLYKTFKCLIPNMTAFWLN